MKWNRKAVEGMAGAWAFRMALRTFRRKSNEGAERSGARLGMLIFWLSKKHRERARSNLAFAMPELSPEERERIARGVFLHFGRMLGDFLRTEVRTDAEVIESVEITGLEHVDAALELGKGVISVGAHFGNFERASQWASANGIPLHAVARDANSSTLNDMVNELRTMAGAKVLSRGNAIRGILETLRKNQIVAILPDQNASEIFVPFFGHPCGCVLGPAVIHERTGAPVIPAYTVWLAPGKYRIIVGAPLTKVAGYEDSPEGMTRAINESLEAIIRQYPEQWLWLHDRWKSARRKGLL